MPIGGLLAAALTSFSQIRSHWQIPFLVGGLIPIGVATAQLLFMRSLDPVAALDTAHASVTTDNKAAHLQGPPKLPLIVATWIACAIAALVLHLLINWLPLLLNSKGTAPLAIARVMMLFNLGGAIGTVLLGRLSELLGPGGPVFALCCAIGSSLLALGAAPDGYILYTGACAAGLLCVGATPVIYATSLLYFPQVNRDAILSTSVSAGRIGGALGPMTVGIIAQLGATPRTILSGVATLALVPGIISALSALLTSRSAARNHSGNSWPGHS
jgi:AAHS family 3-hydroxyphenylpropionic acid transporter